MISYYPTTSWPRYSDQLNEIPTSLPSDKKFFSGNKRNVHTLEGSTLGKLLTTERTLSMTSSLVRWSSCEDIHRKRVVEALNGWSNLRAVRVRVWTGTRTWRSRADLNAISLSLSLSRSPSPPLGFCSRFAYDFWVGRSNHCTHRPSPKPKLNHLVLRTWFHPLSPLKQYLNAIKMVFFFFLI